MRFLDCGTKPLGIYPVVDRAYKLEALYQAGITTAQLRVKEMSDDVLENEIIEAIRISEKYDARLFVNDFWELAIKHKAYGIHLGQEDIREANIRAMHQASIRLGISTHTRDEIKVAEHIEPSYLAIGPIFETNSKKMVYDPVGIEDLKRWSRNVNYPIVAIGGINLDTIEQVVETQAANGVAMIAGVLEEGEVSESKTQALIEIFEKAWNA
jgi:thiamine-phosphate pyrophosphorylase/hydroxymethylpyrimidine kinase/phosphomethylpyrimidine kinase/thiamine-phosphate diphosphorylase